VHAVTTVGDSLFHGSLRLSRQEKVRPFGR
jgi:hypothetical protein